MSIKISVREYRGIERADIELAPICLVSGKNEQGKSCLAEAVRAVLAGEPIPIPGINKKDAKLLVRDGAKEGRSVASIGDEFTEVSWPKAEYAGNTESLWCSRFAVGLEHLFDLDTKERSKVLARYVNSTPTVGDLGQAMRDIGYGDKAIDKTWGAIQTEGWDSTHKKAREHGTKLKGQWEGVAREKYGAKKAEGWTPTNYPDMAVVLKHDPEDDPREVILATIERARARVKETVGSAAVSQAEVDRLKALADEKPENVKPLQKDLKKLQADLEAVEAERRALPAEGKNGANTVCDCPKCGAKLTVEQAWQGPVMLKPYDEDAEKQASSKEMRLKRSELDGKAANLKGKINEAHRRIAADENDADRIAEAKKRLAEIGDYKEPDIETVRAAEQAEADARATMLRSRRTSSWRACWPRTDSESASSRPGSRRSTANSLNSAPRRSGRWCVSTRTSRLTTAPVPYGALLPRGSGEPGSWRRSPWRAWTALRRW
jgi:hypothetical protein